jgi:hypothetical protein
MKKHAFFILVILISFVSCDTLTRYTIGVSVDREPVLTIINRTGYDVDLDSPVSGKIKKGETTQCQPPETRGIITVAYKIGLMYFTERVTMDNQDATVTLTRFPPTLTIVNNTGVTINNFFLRYPGAPSWIGGNIVIRGGRLQPGAAGGAQIGDISGSIVNGDSGRIWLGDLEISGDQHVTDYRFDVRIDDVQGNTYVKSNVQILSDITATFTRSDRP